MDVQSVVWLVVCLAVIAGSILALAWRSCVKARQLQLRVQKLYSSQIFDDMLPLLKAAKKHLVEQVLVDKTGVVIRLLYPVGNEMAFLMRANGYQYLTNEQQEAMRAVWEECVPKLADRNRYYLNRKRVKLINGDVEYHYSYIMLNAYKNKLVRAPYYDGTLQARLW